MDKKSSIKRFHHSLTELLLKSVYDDVVEVEFSNGTKGRLFIKYYEGEAVYFDENALYHLHGAAMAKLFDIENKNIYRSIKSIEEIIKGARITRYIAAKTDLSATSTVISKGSGHTSTVISEGSGHTSTVISEGSGHVSPINLPEEIVPISRKPGRPRKDSTNNDESGQYYPRAIEVSIMDGMQRRHYRLYPPAIINLIIGRTRGMNSAAVDFLELMGRLFELHVTAGRQLYMEAYQQGYEDGGRAAVHVAMESNSTDPHLMQTLIDTQAKLIRAYEQRIEELTRTNA